MERLFLIPRKDLVLPSPDHRPNPLPADGGWVAPSAYWTARLADGDVTDGTDAQLKREAAEAKADAKASK